MNLTKAVLKRPVTVLIVVLALIVFGFTAITGSPLELMPPMETPMMIVMTVYPGAGPEDVENLVTSQIEKAVSTLGGIKNVMSTSQDSVSMVMLELNYGTNMDVANIDLQKKLSMYQNALPDDAETPMIIEMSMDMMPTITLSANATGDVDLLQYIDDEVTPEFEKLSGVASVDVSGGQRDYISVELSEEKLEQYKLDMNSVVNFVGSADFSIPAGNVDRGDQSLILRGGVSYNTTESLKDIPITLKSGQVIRLSDVANVRQATEKADSVSRYNGLETVTLSVTKRQSASTLDVTRAVNKTLEEINARHIGVELSVISDSSTDIMASVNSVVMTLILAIVICMLVLFFFFGDWRASLIVGSSIPISVLTTLILMNAMDFSLNVVSLGGLVIGVGMMVDNSIVVLESCFQRRERNLSFRRSAIEGAQMVTSSVVASTITTIVVFLPISLLEGMSGQMFRQLGFTIIFSLTASLVSALTLVPLLFFRISPKEKDGWAISSGLKKIEIAYGGFLKKTFRVKPIVVLVSVGLLVLSLFMVKFIPFQLMPDIDQGMIDISISTKPGLKLEELDKVIASVETIVSQSPDVERYSITGGGGGSPFGTGGSSGSVSVYLKSDRELSTKEWVDIWREQTKNAIGSDIEISASSMMSMLTGGSSIDVHLQGNDLDVLREASLQVENMMRSDPDIVRVSSNLTSGDPQAEINVDPIKAIAAGLTPKQVIGTVRNVMSGSSPAKLKQNGRDYDIRLEYPEGKYQSVSDLSGLMLASPTGRMIPLLDIASVEYSNAPQQINRQNNQYLVTVTAQPKTSAELTAPAKINAAAKNLTFPQGVSIMESDASEAMNEEFGALFGAIATAVLLVFMAMAIQFESTRFSLIVMVCIPFALIGSFGLMLSSGVTMSMPSLMGFLMLVGTVINNGILFIDTANQLRGSMDAETALIYAGRSRLRPILMTTLTTVLSMAPMALGLGTGAEAMQGMAVVIIGGLCASTLLTLLLLPTFYLLFRGKAHSDFENKNDLAEVNPPHELSNEELITE